MFICDKCNKSTQNKESMNKVTTKSRKKQYYNILFTKKRTGDKIILHHKPTERELKEYKLNNYEIAREWYTEGLEIEKELKLCGGCYAKEKI